MEQLSRAHADLETRRQCEEREQVMSWSWYRGGGAVTDGSHVFCWSRKRLELERRRTLLDVQQAQRAQMARHREVESRRRAEEAAAGDAVRRAQDDADRRAAAASSAKKERAIANGQVGAVGGVVRRTWDWC